MPHRGSACIEYLKLPLLEEADERVYGSIPFNCKGLWNSVSSVLIPSRRMMRSVSKLKAVANNDLLKFCISRSTRSAKWQGDSQELIAPLCIAWRYELR